MATIRAHFDGRVLVPDEPVDLPAGTPVSVSQPADAPASAVDTSDWHPALAAAFRAARESGLLDDTPPDFSEQHDHYLYGTPKRDNP